MTMHQQEKALLRLLVHQPDRISRNRNFALFKNPRAAHLRKRAAHLRAVAKHLGELPATSVTAEATETSVTLHFTFSDEAYRVAVIDREELDILAETDALRQHPALAPFFDSPADAQPTDT